MAYLFGFLSRDLQHRVGTRASPIIATLPKPYTSFRRSMRSASSVPGRSRSPGLLCHSPSASGSVTLSWPRRTQPRASARVRSPQAIPQVSPTETHPEVAISSLSEPPDAPQTVAAAPLWQAPPSLSLYSSSAHTGERPPPKDDHQ